MRSIAKIIFGAVLFLTACSNGLTNQDVPASLTTNLMSAFPVASGIEWERVGENYEAEFEVDNVEYTALMNPSGDVLMYKHDVASAAFPDAVKASINQNYGEMKADDYERLLIDGAEYYQVELDNVGKVFTAAGQEQIQVAYWE